ncbi:MAG: hypothetical protein ABIM40_16545 [Pseudomonadota bacterium]
MDRNRLKGVEGDRINAILSAAGMNFHKLLRHEAECLRLLFWALSNATGPLSAPTRLALALVSQARMLPTVPMLKINRYEVGM